jgi:hypothetical protein
MAPFPELAGQGVAAEVAVQACGIIFPWEHTTTRAGPGCSRVIPAAASRSASSYPGLPLCVVNSARRERSLAACCSHRERAPAASVSASALLDYSTGRLSFQSERLAPTHADRGAARDAATSARGRLSDLRGGAPRCPSFSQLLHTSRPGGPVAEREARGLGRLRRRRRRFSGPQYPLREPSAVA